MKETLMQYAAYNVWANKRIIDVALKLPESKVDEELVSSFSSIRKTVLHCWSAEYIWLQRLQLAEQPVWIESVFTGTFEEACGLWQNVSAEIVHFTGKQFNDAAFDHKMQYYTRQRQPMKNRVGDVLLHVFNHATYHRGQLVTMLRQCGATAIPSTDFISFVWNNQS